MPLLRLAAAAAAVVLASRLDVASAAGNQIGALLDGGKPICENGVWTEHAPTALENLEVMPDVQCWRDPVCIRWSYARPSVCQRLKKDEDWPVRNPHTVVPPNAKTAGDMMRDLLRNKTIAFIGDSINNLVFRAFLCEIAKEDYLTFKTKDHVMMPGASRSVEARLEEYWHHLSRFKHKHENTPGGWWLGEQPLPPEVVSETETFIAVKGWHKYKDTDMEGILSMMDVVVLNYALHYNPENGQTFAQMLDHYEREMRKMMTQMNEFGSKPGKVAIFRETGAQHFEKTGGFTSWDQGHPDSEQGCSCAALTDENRYSNTVTQRNDVILKLAKEFPNVRVIPFYELTVPQHDLHENAWCAFEQARSTLADGNGEVTSFCCDCTHICYTPQMWKYFFNDLYQIVDQSTGFKQLAHAHGHGGHGHGGHAHAHGA